MTFDDILESKLARIGVGINKWRTSKDNGSYENGIGTMVYPTGFGKTIAGIEIVNLIHSKNSNGYEKWQKFDEDDDLIHYKDSNGKEESYNK